MKQEKINKHALPSPAENGKFWLPADEEFRKVKKDQFEGDTKTGQLLMVSTIVKEAFTLVTNHEEFPSFEALHALYQPSASKKSVEAAAPPSPG